jgi:hypothetical protein
MGHGSAQLEDRRSAADDALCIAMSAFACELNPAAAFPLILPRDNFGDVRADGCVSRSSAGSPAFIGDRRVETLGVNLHSSSPAEAARSTARGNQFQCNRRDAEHAETDAEKINLISSLCVFLSGLCASAVAFASSLLSHGDHGRFADDGAVTDAAPSFHEFKANAETQRSQSKTRSESEKVFSASVSACSAPPRLHLSPKGKIMQPLERILGSMKFWTALGALIVCICSVIGLDAQKATTIVTATTVLAGAVIAATGYEDGQEKSNTPVATPTPSVKPATGTSSTSTPNMNALGWLLIPLLFVVAATNIGCANSPTSRWAQERDGLTTAQNTILSARANEFLTDADLIALDPFVQAVRTALKDAQAQLPAGGDLFDSYLSQAIDALTHLSPDAITQLEANHGNGSGNSGGASTRPAAGAAGGVSQGLRASPGIAGAAVWRVHAPADHRHPDRGWTLGRELGLSGGGGEGEARRGLIV